VAARPLVSVVMATYNDAATLRESIDSVLAQTYGDLELIVVDDGSTDATADVLAAVRDPRLKPVKMPANAGLAAALNRGFEEARGVYIARLDADDLAMPERLAHQVERLEAEPELGILGSAIELFGGGAGGARSYPTGDLEVHWRLLLESPFAHPSVTLRRAVLEARALRFDPAFHVAQDYDLWSRLLRHCRGGNLAEPLVRYRVRPGGLTGGRRARQLEEHQMVSVRAIGDAVPDHKIDAETIRALPALFVGREWDGWTGPIDYPVLARELLRLLDAFSARHAGDPELVALRRREARRVARRLMKRAPWMLPWLAVRIF
jgi:glycosyltransferase involved in cell wall biosynthesis